MNLPISAQYLDSVRRYRRRWTQLVPSLPGVPYLFLSPFFVLFACFLAFPIFYTFYLSFFEFQGINSAPLFWIDFGLFQLEIPSISDLEFVGLDNYRRLFNDNIFHQSLFNTVYIFVTQIPIMIILALGLAIALNTAYIRFKGLFRSIIILPVSANLVAYSVVFLIIMAEGGLADLLFQAVGLNPINWLQNGFWSRNLVVFMSIWRWTGYNMIILLAGLQTVSQPLYEAAELDGANKIQKFWHVTIPQIKPVLLFVFITSTIGVFKKFAEPQILIQWGVPVTETRTVLIYIYQIAFNNLELGYASALSYTLITIIIVLSLIQMRWAS